MPDNLRFPHSAFQDFSELAQGEMQSVRIGSVIEHSLGRKAMTTNGLITIESRNGPEETMNRFEAEVRARGMTVFAHIDHAAGATAAGLPLRPTELLIFGHAKTGTPLMQSNQMIGIDLPLKTLVWQDASGTTWLSYNDPAFLAHHHGVDGANDTTVNAMAAALQAIASKATTAT
ncbi:DUF302 domain-containing protein [Bradyrhizobium sp. UFLA05-112]